MEYGLIGEKLSHSFSKEVHGRIGGYSYELKEIARGDLKDFISNKDFKGLNVTIPYKQEIIGLLDYVDQTALDIGAVNTVVNDGGRLCGYNTDCLGVQCLIDNLGLVLEGKKVIILGTGGTSKTVKSVVTNNRAKTVLTVSRSAGKGDITYQELYSKHSDCDFIFNTTPVGMYPNLQCSPVELEKLPCLKGVVDVIYNPLQTKLVTDARRLGIHAIGGLYMLVAQAVYAYGYFFGKNVPKELIDDIYAKILSTKTNVVLIGMPSCGKTTVGNIIAQTLGRQLIDTDQLIVETLGVSIPEIFQTKGEQYFREQEALAIAKASACNGVVISTGGGAVLNPGNVEILKQNGKLFFIDRPLDSLITTSDRPLSSDRAKLEKMFSVRYPLYVESADVKVDGSKTPNQIANQIVKEL